jgi:LCP family protein required for cell wall assembly
MARVKNKRMKIWLSFTMLLLTVGIIVPLACFLYFPLNTFGQVLNLNFHDNLASSQGTSTEKVFDPFNKKREDRLNIALLGFDSSAGAKQREDIFRPDTILIISLDFATSKASMVSIPRDSYVKIHGSDSYDKINHSYMHGYVRASGNQDPREKGIKNTLLTIGDFLGGIPLHGYVALDLDGAAEIIDIIGGIYYPVEITVYADDHRSILLLDKGYQHLNGRELLYYLRDRDPLNDGEMGRIKRQQKVLIALAKKLITEGRLADYRQLYETVSKSVKTDISLHTIASLVSFALQADLNSIDSYVFGGSEHTSYQYGQNAWLWLIDEDERVKIIRDVFGVTVSRNPDLTIPGPYYPVTDLEDDTEYIIDMDYLENFEAELLPENDYLTEEEVIVDEDESKTSETPANDELSAEEQLELYEDYQPELLPEIDNHDGEQDDLPH